MDEPLTEIPQAQRLPERRLDSWKEIAAHLNRDVTTVQRWEKREGMPVHRHAHEKRGSVYALPGELDAWVQSRRVPVEEPEGKVAAERSLAKGSEGSGFTIRRARLRFALGAGFCVFVLAAGWIALRHRQLAAGPPRIRSLAVLPLRNLSGDPAQDYLADGITEALIGRLANLQDLRVISHTSVLRFKNPQMSVPEIAKILGVDAIVEGSVIRDGNRIRVTAQLVRGATDEHFWSETYDRDMRDTLTLESDLAQTIAEKVEVTVTGREMQRLSAVRPVAPEVYESYLKGEFVLNRGNNREDLEQSIRDFEDAVRRDSTFAPAYLGLAEAWTSLGTVTAGVPPAKTRPQVAMFARKALTLDPDLVEAHVVLANTLQEEWRWSEAEAEYRRALELNPNAASANAGFASWLLCEGRTGEAVTSIERARALDPFAVSGESVSWILFQDHRYGDAVRESRNAVALEPDNAGALLGLGFALIANNQAADAVPVLERSVSLSKGGPAAVGILIRAYAHAGRRGDALRLLAQLKKRSRTGYIPAAAFVNAYLGLGDNDRAFYWLEQAYKEQSNMLQFMKTHPYFDPIRGDPRFVDLERRVGLG
ncbi:MAG TPA: tetratricopeptide repeat protein [Terracidiphilus sp.]|nr:tetratricopeptide repeat protein [Terracidiphilus sp.]